MSMTITNIDLGAVFLKAGPARDELLTFGGAGTVAAGTILARSSATDNLIPYVKGGSTDGNGIPRYVVSYDVSAAAAGDVKIRVATSGTVALERLVIAADGDASNVDQDVVDDLRQYALIEAATVEQLARLDNQ